VDQQPPGRIKDIRVYRDSFIGMALMVCTPFLIFGAIKVYGWPAAIGLFAGWLVLFALGTRWFMSHPRWVVLAALFSMVCWLGAVLIAN
jgi:hypothetical protein